MMFILFASLNGVPVTLKSDVSEELSETEKAIAERNRKALGLRKELVLEIGEEEK